MRELASAVTSLVTPTNHLQLKISQVTILPKKVCMGVHLLRGNAVTVILDQGSNPITKSSAVSSRQFNKLAFFPPSRITVRQPTVSTTLSATRGNGASAVPRGIS